MSRNFDSSQLTARKHERAVSGSFLAQVSTAPGSGTTYMRGSQPMLGIKDSSIMNSVRTGGMTQYTRFPTCVGISVGCPCPGVNPLIPMTVPGYVSGITFTVGSIVVSWTAPTTGDGPFTYRVVPYLNGVAQAAIVTANTSYHFNGLQDWQPYTFTVCAINGGGDGPHVLTPYFLAPPSTLSGIMAGSTDVIDPVPSLKYIINAALDNVLQYIASVNLGPTKSSRLLYVFVTSLVGAWNRVCADSRITDTHDQWNWDIKVSPLSDNDAIIWMTCVIDYLTPLLIPVTYTSIYNCPTDVVTRVRNAGNWSSWVAQWQVWFAYRQNDGFVAASTQQPTDSANWNVSLIVDGTTVNNIAAYPQPREWTRLTVEGKKQGYLTYHWNNVLSTCLTEADEIDIQNSVAPVTGAARDTEIDNVKDMTALLSNYEKMVAEFWAGGKGTVSPPMMCVWLWKEYMRSINSLSSGSLMFSLQDLAIHLFEGGRVTWHLKKLHMQDRPIQEIRRRYTGQAIASWNGVVDGAQWVPYQATNFVTPPFADFPSGHSHFSKAFALTMNKWFGTDIVKNNIYYDMETLFSPIFTTNQSAFYGDFMISPGSSTVEPGVAPSSHVTLSFATWDEMADSAGISRLYGGIHALSAHNNSQTVAVEVDGYINSTWNIHSAPIMPNLTLVEPWVAPSELIEEPIMAASEPVAPVAEPVAPVVEPVVEPVAEPVAEPVVEPVAEPVVEPVAEPVAPVAPVTEPVAEPVADPVNEVIVPSE